MSRSGRNCRSAGQGEEVMSEPIVYVDHSDVREGKLEELKGSLKELADFVETNEPQILSYTVYLNEDQTRITVMHLHRDAPSLAFHMDVGGEVFPRFAELVNLRSIDVYGAVTDDIVEQLRAKARL